MVTLAIIFVVGLFGLAASLCYLFFSNRVHSGVSLAIISLLASLLILLFAGFNLISQNLDLKSEEESPRVEEGEPVELNPSGCVLEWKDLRIVGNYGAITVANKSNADVEVWVSATGMSLQAKLEPKRGIRLRSGVRFPETDMAWTVKLSTGESRSFDFLNCLPLACDLQPAYGLERE